MIVAKLDNTNTAADARLLFLSLLWLLVNSLATAQSGSKYCFPIDSPFVLTANYGEIRPNHFHAGLDFSTAGQVNLPVYAVSEGYLSRIRVSSGGYGKCAYLTHRDGHVTVYAHLNAFSLKLNKVIKKEQYAQKKNEIDFLPIPQTVFVKKNEIIGMSGNSGGSTGPHLHFEVRDGMRDVPLNPLAYFQFHDQTPPELTHLAFYSLADTITPKLIRTCKLKMSGDDSLFTVSDRIVLDEAIVGLAFSGFDKTGKNGSLNGIYGVKLFQGDRMIYSHTMNNIPFEDGRYVNEFTATHAKVRFQKCFLPTLYPSGFYGTVFDKGRIVLPDSGFQKLRLVLTDEAGNSRTIAFMVRTRKFNFYHSPVLAPQGLVKCNEDVQISENGLVLFTPAKTLYGSVSLTLTNALANDRKLTILPAEANLNSPAIIGFVVPATFSGIQSKLVLKNENELYCPINRNDSIYFLIKNFGKYQLLVDTLAPDLVLHAPSNKSKKTENDRLISFHITDKLSGLGKYDLFINDKWVIADYDSKTNLLTYFFDEDTPVGLLQIRLEVEDKVGNRETLKCSLSK